MPQLRLGRQCFSAGPWTRQIRLINSEQLHHRSQIDTYARLEGWDVPHIYGRSRESIDELQEEQRRRAGL